MFREFLLAANEAASNDKSWLLVGGQALAYWASEYESLKGVETLRQYVSFDIDLLANSDFLSQLETDKRCTIRRAQLEDHTPNMAIVRFRANGETIDIDILQGVFGLDEANVKRNAFPVTFEADGKTVSLWIMSPQCCLLSRLANLGLPEKRDEHAIDQLVTAIEVAEYFVEFFANKRPRLAHHMYNQCARWMLVYGSGRSRVKSAIRDFGVDPTTILAIDYKFSDQFSQIQLPAMIARRNKFLTQLGTPA